MKITESFTGNRKDCYGKFIMFKFDTGHTYQKFQCGVEFFTAAGRGQILNPNSKNGPKLIEEMRRLTK